MRASRLSSLAAIALVAGLSLATPLRAETILLQGFTLIDGTGRPVLAGAAIRATDGRIVAVGPVSRVKARPGDQVVRLDGKFVMPGMIDTHVHLGLTSDGLSVNAANQTPANVETQLRRFASYGVTTVVSQGTDQDVILERRRAQRASGRPMEARIFSAGLGVVYKGGYGGLAGVTKKVASPAEARTAVDREADRGADMIKFWLDSELDTMPRLPADISAATISAAHDRKLPVVAHIFYSSDAARVVDQGIDGLSHAVRDQPVDAALIASMKRRGTWQMASTLARENALFAYGAPAPWLDDSFFRQSVNPATLAQLADPARQARTANAPNFAALRGFFEMAKRNLKTLADAGIPYAMGTDAGGPLRFPGHAEHAELAFMVDAGLTPMQAIVAATGSGAKFLKARDLGTLERGKWADLVVLDGDPTADIRNTRLIAAVYIAGRPVASIDR